MPTKLNAHRILPPPGQLFPPERSLDITASTCGALFGENDYTSEWALWQRYANGMLPGKPGKLAAYGSILEPGIAALLEIEHGLTLEKEEGYLRDPALRIGASLDYRCYRWGEQDLEFPDGIPLDVKLVSGRAWASKWKHGESVPNQYALQIQMQCALTGASQGLLGCLIAGEDTKVIRVPFSPALFDELLLRVKDFWRRVEAKIEPLADPREDTDDLLRIYKRVAPGTTLDLTGDNEAGELCAQYLALSNLSSASAKAAREADKERTIIKAALFQKMKSNETARVGNFLIETESRSRKGYTVQASESRALSIEVT
jgi:predicted phage-related endonuclease